MKMMHVPINIRFLKNLPFFYTFLSILMKFGAGVVLKYILTDI